MQIPELLAQGKFSRVPRPKVFMLKKYLTEMYWSRQYLSIGINANKPLKSVGPTIFMLENKF